MKRMKFLLKDTHFLLIIFIIFYLIWCFLTYKNIPITSDEEFRYTRGKELLSFYLNSTPLQNYFMPSILPNQYYFYTLLLNILNPNFYYEQFHLANMVFATIILISAYFLVLEYSGNKIFSILSPVLILLTPSFSGHIGLNPIDIPFSVMFLLNILLIYKYKDTAFDFNKSLILGFSFFLLLGLRPLGFQIFILYIFFSIVNFLHNKKLNLLIEDFKNLVIIFFVSMFLLVITWPYLGINIYKNLYFTFENTASFNRWEGLMLFYGDFITKSQRPWYYLFVYIFLTTPFFILVSFFISLFKKLNLIKIFLLITIIFNLLIYLVIKPVIYNGMRHFLFLIPFIIILSCFGIYDLFLNKFNKYFKYLMLISLLTSFIYTIFYIFKLYPNQYSYFNEISGGVENNIYKFDTEYWGGSYKQAAEYIRDKIVKSDNPYEVKVYACNMSYAMDYYSHKKFLMTLKKEDANYTVCTAPEDKRRKYNGEIIKSINLGSEPFIIIRKNSK